MNIYPSVTGSLSFLSVWLQLETGDTPPPKPGSNESKTTPSSSHLVTNTEFQHVPSVKLTARTYQEAITRGNDRLPTIHFQVRTVSLLECNLNSKVSWNLMFFVEHLISLQKILKVILSTIINPYIWKILEKHGNTAIPKKVDLKWFALPFWEASPRKPEKNHPPTCSKRGG